MAHFSTCSPSWTGTAGAELAAFERHGGVVRSNRSAGSIACSEIGAGQIWHARDLQLRSGLPIHRYRVHRGAAGRQGTYLDGRSQSLDRQPNDRKAVAVVEPKVRAAKYECVYLDAVEASSEVRDEDGGLDQLLQRNTPALIAWVADAD